MNVKYSYVEWIQNNKIDIYCSDEEKIKKLKYIGAKKRIFKKNNWSISYCDDNELIKIISFLRDCNFSFAFDEHGWSPSAIFQYFREKGLLHGKFIEIFWRGRNKIDTHET